MFLDGSELTIGDTLYDIVSQQTGTVIEVGQDTFQLSIGGSESSVREGGYIGRVKRIYWHNPIIVTPTKDSGETLTKLRAIAEII